MNITEEQLEERIESYRNLLKCTFVEWRLKEVDEVFTLAREGLRLQQADKRLNTWCKGIEVEPGVFSGCTCDCPSCEAAKRDTEILDHLESKMISVTDLGTGRNIYSPARSDVQCLRDAVRNILNPIARDHAINAERKSE